ncbi:MAG: hypothetical protein ACLUKN_06415 [Bacilli bacterium]
MDVKFGLLNHGREIRQIACQRIPQYEFETNVRQFLDGMKKLAQDIRALGFKPGLWMAPFEPGTKISTKRISHGFCTMSKAILSLHGTENIP